MFANYIKSAYRSMVRNITHTIINVLGLAVGMTCALIIFLWVQNQLSYDQGQENKDRIGRLEYATWVSMPPYISDYVKQMPEVEDMVRVFLWDDPTVRYKENSLNIHDFIYADSSIFNIFSFDFTYGSKEMAFSQPYSIILSETIAKRLFGDKNPIGEEVSFYLKTPFTVTGVYKNINNIHLDVNAIVSLQDRMRLYNDPEMLSSRGHNYLIYTLLKPNIDHALFQEKLRETDFNENDDDAEGMLIMRPFNDIYFTRGLSHENEVKHGNRNLVYVFSAISVLILLIACINFINIATAKAKMREKEIGIRKIVGSDRKKLILQLIGETFLLVIVAHIVSIVLLEIILPYFNVLTGEFISFSYLSPQFLILIISTILFTTLLSGAYPSFYLSGLIPVQIIKGKSGSNSPKGNLRKALIIVQYTVSIFLIISTLTIVKQLFFVLEKDLGWDQKNKVTFNLRGDKFRGEAEDYYKSKDALKNELLKNPNIKNITYVNQLPGEIKNTWSWYLEGKECEMKMIHTNPDFLKVFGLELIEGRNLDYNRDRNNSYRFIINETAVKQLGLKNPIGNIEISDGNMEIIGVVKDFNFNSLHNKIDPVGIRCNYWGTNAIVQIQGNDIAETLKHIKELYNEFCPGYPFEYEFLDESFSAQYKSEMQLSKVLIFFACIAVFIAGLGLFGMSSFMTITRRKEIGLRKAIGSSTSEIIMLFSKSYTQWILISFLIASPVSWFLLKEWLAQYPYQTNISAWVFLLALLISVMISLITIGYQVIKSARMNPANSLRYE